MIAALVTAGEVVGVLALWVVALVALWRWPGLALGLAGALALWTVAAWVAWLALVAVACAALGWRLITHGRRVSWPVARSLLRRPALAVLVVSAGLAGLAPEPVAPVAFVVLVVSAGLLAWWWPSPEHHQSTGGPGVIPSPAPMADRLASVADSAARAVVSGPCGRCGGLLVAEASAAADPAGLVARAFCGGCGLRLVGVVDVARPGAGLVWFELPEVRP